MTRPQTPEGGAVCQSCNGHGLIDTSFGQTPETYQPDAMTCLDCEGSGRAPEGVDVPDPLAVLDSEIASLHAAHNAAVGRARERFAERHGNLTEARAAVAEQQRILRQLAAWNRNPNGDGVELDEICASAELLVGRAGRDEPRRGVEQLEFVAGAIKALKKIADFKGNPATPIASSVKKSAIARAALSRMGPQP